MRWSRKPGRVADAKATVSAQQTFQKNDPEGFLFAMEVELKRRWYTLPARYVKFNNRNPSESSRRRARARVHHTFHNPTTLHP